MVAFLWIFELGRENPPTLLFFFEIVLSSLNLLHFHANFSFCLSISYKKIADILIRIILNL